MKLKRILAFTASVSLVVGMLSGCQGSGNSVKDTGKDTAVIQGTQSQSGTEPGVADDKEKQSGNIDFTEAPVNLVVEVVDLGMEMKDVQEVTDAVNEILLEKINCTIQFQQIHIADHATKVALAVAGGEKLDVIMTGRTTSLPGMVSDGTLIPLDELIAQRGQVFTEKASELLDGLKINGSIYAVPGNLYVSAARGISYNADLAAELGVNFSDVKSLDDLAAIGQQLVDGGSGVYLATRGDGSIGAFSNFYSMELFGGDMIYGGIMNPVESDEIVNVFKSEEYKHYCHVMKEWADKGFTPSDSMVSGENGQDVFRNGICLIQVANDISPLGLADANKGSFEVKQVAMTENVLATSMIQEVGWGITTTCERPDKAMDFLNLMYSDGELANLLYWGIEGKHYEKVSDMIIKYPDGVDSNSVGYRTVFNRWGDAAQIYSLQPTGEELYGNMKPYMEASKKSKTLGYVFDAEPVSTEIAAVSSVISEYRPSLECGQVKDVDAALDEFNEKLDGAGINMIIEENQKQLAQWLEQNGTK